MDQLSDKVKSNIEAESKIFEEAMTAAREAHWQNRVVQHLQLIDQLEIENATLREELAEIKTPEEVHEVTDLPVSLDHQVGS